MAAHLRLEDLPDPSLTSHSIQGAHGTLPVLVVRRGLRITAFLDVCPHAHLPLSSGSLTAEGIVCPHHQWVFDPDTGRAKNLSVVHLEPMEVRVEGSLIQIRRVPPAV